jgi:hypothetical protein
MRIMRHLIATRCRTFWRLLCMAAFSAALAASVAVLVAYEGTRKPTL